jgi:hypothetical protein
LKYFQKVTQIQPRKTTIQSTTTDHEITTTSPQKTIKKTQLLAQPRLKPPLFTSERAAQAGGPFF